MSEKGRFETTRHAEVWEVDMNQWGTVTPPDIIETTELGPCVGIIMYDSKNNIGLCGHLIDPRMNLKEMLEDAKKNFSNPENLEIYLGGQSPIDEPYFKEDSMVRKFTMNLLQKYGYDESQISAKWQDSDEATVMRLNTLNGEIEYETQEMWDILNEDI